MFGCYVLGTYYFLMKDRKGVHPQGRGNEEELRGGGEGEIKISIYCMRK